MAARYVINPGNKTFIFHDETGDHEITPASVQIEDENAFPLFTDRVDIGSLASTTEMDKLWRKHFDGTWKRVEFQ